MRAAALPLSPTAPTPTAGWVAMGLTLLIWASFPLSIRAIGGSSLTPVDVALLRFGIPALVLLPVLRSRAAVLRALPWRLWALIGGGAGLPFLLVAAAGGRAASASHVSALIAGTTPLSFALLGALCWGLPVERRRWPALAAIVAGVLLMVAGLDSPGGTPWLGAAWLLLASGMWSAYTHGLRLAGLDPLGGMVVVTYPSLLATLALLGSGLVDSHLGSAPARELWLFGAVQGVAVGLLSTFCYGQSVRLLGPQRSAMTGALAPVLATAMAVPLLGEWPGPLALAGLLAISAGVLRALR